MEVSGQLYSLGALFPRKEPSVPIGKEARWAPEPVWTRWQREKDLSACRGSKSDSPARSLVTILTELPELQIIFLGFICLKLIHGECERYQWIHGNWASIEVGGSSSVKECCVQGNSDMTTTRRKKRKGRNRWKRMTERKIKTKKRAERRRKGYKVEVMI
jgi:hypothetical protein